MSDISIRTWKDLLFPNELDTQISLLQVNDTGRRSTSTSAPVSGGLGDFRPACV